MEYYNRDKEIREAIEAGERALVSLHKADEKLGSARNWGFLDILGGNVVTGILKHSRLAGASRCIEEAKVDLRNFQRELGDVQGLDYINVDVGEFMAFADFFLDGLVMDFVVQQKISDARRQVQSAIARTEFLLGQLVEAKNS
jgi:hypothetical protein